MCLFIIVNRFNRFFVINHHSAVDLQNKTTMHPDFFSNLTHANFDRK